MALAVVRAAVGVAMLGGESGVGLASGSSRGRVAVTAMAVETAAASVISVGCQHTS